MSLKFLLDFLFLKEKFRSHHVYIYELHDECLLVGKVPTKRITLILDLCTTVMEESLMRI